MNSEDTSALLFGTGGVLLSSESCSSETAIERTTERRLVHTEVGKSCFAVRHNQGSLTWYLALPCS
jgi:hypothetical protein